MFIDCGKCTACRVNKANEWALRVCHEMQYANNKGCFITLTYDNKNLPKCKNKPTLMKKHLQDFVKRLRRYLEYHNLGSIRAYFGAGEYGKRTHRPHYHIIVLGWSPCDSKYLATTACKSQIYISDIVSQCWQYGFHSIGDLSFRSAAYVARYTKKMINCDDDEIQKPFNLSSRNIPTSDGRYGALGKQWVLDHVKDCFNLPYLSMDEFKLPIPDYYIDILSAVNPNKAEDLRLMKMDYMLGNDNHVMAHTGSVKRVFDVQSGQMIDDNELLTVYQQLDDLQLSKLSTLHRA